MLTDRDLTQLAADCGFVLHETAAGRLVLQPALLRFGREVERATVERLCGGLAPHQEADLGPPDMVA